MPTRAPRPCNEIGCPNLVPWRRRGTMTRTAEPNDLVGQRDSLEVETPGGRIPPR
jgi:hypothetical protein